MALLGPICTVAAGRWVRTQVDGGYTTYGLWRGLKQRFTLRQQLTMFGLCERIRAWPIDEASVRAEFPNGEAATQKSGARAGHELPDTWTIGF